MRSYCQHSPRVIDLGIVVCGAIGLVLLLFGVSTSTELLPSTKSKKFVACDVIILFMIAATILP
jgi:hypothetical protein